MRLQFKMKEVAFSLNESGISLEHLLLMEMMRLPGLLHSRGLMVKLV